MGAKISHSSRKSEDDFPVLDAWPDPEYGGALASRTGLCIAKLIVEVHGGEIGVISQDATGTTSTIRLPSHSASGRGGE